MNQAILRRYIRQVISEAYSLGLVRALRTKFKKENPALTDEIIDFYVTKFDQNKDGPRIKGAGKSSDIMSYSWSTLESLIDANFSTSSASEMQVQTDMEPVYQNEDGSLQVFLGDRREKCIAIRQSFEGRSGERYSWCISRSDASNMFYTYRFRMDEPVFYYVFDGARPKNDKYHAVVIYPTASGNYYLADAENRGDKQVTWSQISTWMPKLRNFQEVFKHVPLTEKEIKTYNIVKKKKSDEEFSRLTYDLKEDYISYGHELTVEQIRDIFSLDKSLVNKYCSMNQNVFLPQDIWQKLPPATKKVVEEGFKGQPEAFSFYYEGKKEFSGHLRLTDAPITSLPEGLSVGGDLNLEGTPITSLPEGLSVGGDLVLSHTKITSLPEGLSVGGSLNLTDAPITSLPEGLSVGGDLNLEGTSIASLPEGLTVSENLYLNNARITSLPEGLSVGGDLVLSHTKITSLPEGLSVGGDLGLFGTSISSLPEGLSVGGSLNLGNTPITSLPEGLTVGGSLNLSYTKIASLPEGLSVGGKIIGNVSLSQQYEKRRSQVQSESALRSFVRSILR